MISRISARVANMSVRAAAVASSRRSVAVETDRVEQWLAAHLPSPARALEMLALAALLVVAAIEHAYNMFQYPRYQLDEGTYISQAWSILHGQITPYTYTYGHPPLGWAVIGALTQLFGGFFTFGSGINTGRVVMLWLALASGLLVYLIARELTRSPWAALFATALCTLSPLGIIYQREVLLDNVATLWMLLALYLLAICRSRMTYVCASAFALSIAILSKETMVVFAPAFAFGVWQRISVSQRRFAMIVFCYVIVAACSTFALLALLKGEFFPTGTALGGDNPHVSLISTFMSQAGRGSEQGALSRQWLVWWQTDRLFMAAGMLSLGLNLVLRPRDALARLVPLATISYWIFLARGGVTLAYYVLPIVPLQALNIALCVDSLGLLVGRQARRHEALSRTLDGRLVPVVLLVGMLGFLPYQLRQNTVNFTTDESKAQIEALQWIGASVPRSATIVANHYAWLELRVPGGLAAGYGAPFEHAQMYWEVGTDPAIRDGVLHDDWNAIDYVVADGELLSDVKAYHMDIIAQALAHGVVVRQFSSPLFPVTIYQVQHRGQASSASAVGHVRDGPAPVVLATGGRVRNTEV